MPRPSKQPTYSRRVERGRTLARTWYRGRWHRLPGEYDSPESRAAFADILRRWNNDRATGDHRDMRVDAFAVAFMDHAERKYVKNGEHTSEVHNHRTVMRWAVKLLGREFVRTLHAGHVEELQAALVASGEYNRHTINKHVGRFRSALRWGVSRRMIPPDVVVACECSEPVRPAPGIREPERIAPAPMEDVEAILEHVPHGVAGLLRFQLATGCRPGEAVIAREADIDASGDVWQYRPRTHKTEHHARDRVVMIGPRGQEVVREFLTGNPTDPLFRTRNGTEYDANNYRHSVRRGCGRAGVPTFTPNQLRHTFATNARAAYGLEAASVLLGHSEVDTTTIYAERDIARALEAAAVIG